MVKILLKILIFLSGKYVPEKVKKCVTFIRLEFDNILIKFSGNPLVMLTFHLIEKNISGWSNLLLITLKNCASSSDDP